MAATRTLHDAMSTWRIVTLAVLGLLVLPALCASTAIGIRLDWAGYDLGVEPIFSKFLSPLLAVRWWRTWEPEYRPLFMQGLALAFVPSAVVGLAVLSRWWQGDLQRKASGQEFGSVAQLKTRGQVTNSGAGVVLGKHGSEILRVQGDGHVLVAGLSGSGKGVGVVIPTLLEHPGSMLIHDPKHSLSRICGRHRSKLGPTWIFDPTDRHCDKFNPLLSARRGDQLHGDCEMIATLIATSGEASDPVWEQAAAQVLTALLLVAFEQDMPTLAHVHDLMMKLCASQYPQTSNAFCKQVFDAHQADHHKIVSSVNFTMRARLKFVSDPVVRTVTSGSDINPGDLFCGVDPTTIFVTVPPADRQRMEPLMRVVMQMAMNAGLYSTTHVSDGRAKERDVLLMLDEFPTLRRLDFLETNIAECREYNIRVCAVCQDLAQIRDAYGEHEAITPNCSTAVMMPGLSRESLATIEEWAGRVTVRRRSRGRERFKIFSGYDSESESVQPMLNPREMLERATDEVLVFRSGLPPVYLDKIRYFSERRWAGRFDA
jgi:type IV secretion system protein VirD4